MTGLDDDLPENAEAPLDDDEEEEDEFAASDDSEIDADELEDDLDSDLEDEDGVDIDSVVELTSQEQNARSLEIRRALEERREEKKLHEDLDYLDLDFDD